MAKKCPVCGLPVEDNAKICPYCGVNLENKQNPDKQ